MEQEAMESSPDNPFATFATPATHVTAEFMGFSVYNSPG